MSILRTKDKDGNWIDIPTIVGPTGSTPKIKIGTVVEVPYGNEPKVTLEGTPEEPVMNFEIPEGKPGDHELPEVDFTNMFKIIDIGSLKRLPSNGGAVVIVSEAGNIADKISPILAEGKLPVLYSVAYQGLFFPTFTIEELDRLSQLTFVLHGNLQKATMSNSPRIGTVKLWLQGSYSEGIWNFDPNKNNANIMWSESISVLTTNNTYAYVPTMPYHPATKDYVDEAVANNAGSAIDESVLLHYKGHVDTVEDLDSTGQPSGTLTDQYMGIDNTILGTDETAIAAIKELVGDDYFLGVYNSSNDYLIVSSTDADAFKDISFIKSGQGSTDASGSTYAFVIVDESKEHNIQICCNAGRGVAYLKTPSGSGTLRPSENYKGTVTKLKSIQLYAGADACLYGNVPNALNYVNTPSTGIFHVNSQGNFWTDQASGMTSLRLNFEDNYIYNEGMQCLKSNGDGTLSWVLTDSIAQINDMRTVGDTHDIYVCMPGYVWTPWSQGSSSTEDLPTFVVRGNSQENPIVWSECKKGVYVFEDYTVWYKMDDADSVRKVTVSDYKIYKLYDGIGPNEGKPHFIFFGDIGIYMYNTHTLYNGGNVNGVLMPGKQGTSWTIQGTTFFNYAPQTFKAPLSEHDLTNKKYVDGLLSGMPAGSKITKGTTTEDPIIIDELSVGTHFLSTQNNLVYAKASASTSAGYANLTIGPKLLIVIKKFSDVAQDEICAVFITPDLGTGYITKASTASGIGVGVHTTDTDFLTEVVSAWITGNWGFEHAVECSEAPTSGTHLTNKSYVDTGLGKKQNKVTYGTGDPSGGSDGDVYFKYTA